MDGTCPAEVAAAMGHATIYWMTECFNMHKLTKYLSTAGVDLNPPAKIELILATQRGLGVMLPSFLIDFYLCSNGTARPAQEAIWDWWSLERLKPASALPMSGTVFAQNCGPLNFSKIIVFCDALYGAPFYGINLDETSDSHGSIFGLFPSFLISSSSEAFIDQYIEGHGQIIL